MRGEEVRNEVIWFKKRGVQHRGDFDPPEEVHKIHTAKRTSRSRTPRRVAPNQRQTTEMTYFESCVTDGNERADGQQQIEQYGPRQRQAPHTRETMRSTLHHSERPLSLFSGRMERV